MKPVNFLKHTKVTEAINREQEEPGKLTDPGTVRKFSQIETESKKNLKILTDPDAERKNFFKLKPRAGDFDRPRCREEEFLQIETESKKNTKILTETESLNRRCREPRKSIDPDLF